MGSLATSGQADDVVAAAPVLLQCCSSVAPLQLIDSIMDGCIAVADAELCFGGQGALAHRHPDAPVPRGDPPLLHPGRSAGFLLLCGQIQQLRHLHR